MASFTRRGERWTAQVRRKGIPHRSKTFSTKAEAKAWATLEEARIERGEDLPDRECLRSTTLGDVLRRYVLEVTPNKRGAESEALRLGKLQRDKICQLNFENLTAQEIASYRDRRLRTVRPATVHREIALMAHAIDTAHREWGIRLPKNPAREVRKPSNNAARDRRLHPGELERIEAAAEATRNEEVLLAVRLALATGLRRGELLSLEWRHINLASRLAYIPTTKTGHARSVPLAESAARMLQIRDPKTGKVFAITPNALRKSWTRILQRAGIVDLRFHDLRHEAITRFFELGLSLPEVAMISGHRDPRMLLRYTHLQAGQIAEKLSNI